MNPNTPPPRDDDLPDERELAALYARLSKAEPDPALEAAVLAQATRALPVRRRPRWTVALGSAAVLVLAVGVAWQVRDTHPEATATLPAPPVEQTIPSAERVIAPAPAPRIDVSPPARSKPEARAIQPLAKSATSGHVVLRTMRAPVVSAPRASEPSAAPAPAAPPAPPSAPSPVVPAMQAAAPAADAVEGYMPQPDLGPDDRVGEIRRLLDRGQRDEALRRLRELREHYPQYELPQDLRDLKP